MFSATTRGCGHARGGARCPRHHNAFQSLLRRRNGQDLSGVRDCSRPWTTALFLSSPIRRCRRPLHQANMELIPAELTALTSKTEVKPFLSANEHAQLKAEIDTLVSGIFDEAANRLIDERIEFARRTRQAQIRHLKPCRTELAL